MEGSTGAVRGSSDRKGMENSVGKRLFIGNLSFDVREDDLRAAFEPYGATEVVVPTTDSGRPKGFAFVEVADDQAQAAIQAMNGKELQGREIAVDEARPRPTGDSGGGGRGGYGGGGGRGCYGGGGGGGRRGGRW
jgi:RNA recognition motif-containing protein